MPLKVRPPTEAEVRPARLPPIWSIGVYDRGLASWPVAEGEYAGIPATLVLEIERGTFTLDEVRLAGWHYIDCLQGKPLKGH